MILLITSLGVFIAQLDSQVVNLALKHIAGDFGAGVSTLQWVMDAYNLFYASLLLSGGALGDLYGRGRFYLIGIGLIAGGSMICALAPNAALLIAGRALTGVGAALDVPISLAILAVAYPVARRRSAAIGIWASCNGIAIALGPTIGGLLVDLAGWRSIFALVVPLCLLTMLLAWRFVPNSSDRGSRTLDPAGQGLAIVALGALACVAIEGPHAGLSTPIIALGIAFVLSTAAFFVVEHRTPGPMVPLALFASRNFNAALAGAGAMTFGMYAMMFLTPLYLQQFANATTFGVGVEMLPMSVSFIIVSQAAGRLGSRFGARAVMTAGLACMGCGLLLLTQVTAIPNLWLIEAALLIIGVGLGLNTAPVNAVAVASVPRHRAGTASGLVNTLRMTGATLGIAVLGAIYAVHAQAGAPEQTIAGLRMAYLGGAAVELAGAAVVFVFISADALACADG
ncbi:MAG: MFS transporter [Proteobacteria bacterium]|nr:MFS transporter [Pseudomonadota bacterium]